MKRPTEIDGSLLLLTLLLAGCGSSDDSSGPAAPCNLILAVATGGLSCAFKVILGSALPTYTPPPTTAPPPTYTPPPTTAPPPVVNESSPLVLSQTFDVEPNDSLPTAVAANFPTPLVPDQKIGFYVNGTINNLTDGVDTYAFTAARSRTFGFQICEFTPPNRCGSGNLDHSIAYFNVLDQFGNVLLSSQGSTVNGTYQEMWIDAGVLYYVMVLAEDTANRDRRYSLQVFETTSEVGSVAQKPGTVVLSTRGWGQGGGSITTMLDWIPPTMNVDGTPLLDLAGYNVYLGPESGMYLDFRHLDNPGLVTYVLDLPSSGSWFIVITALDSAGNESDFSNEAVVDVLCECDLPPGDPELMP